MTPLEIDRQIDRVLLYLIVALVAVIGMALVLGATIKRIDRIEARTGPNCVKIAVMTPDGVTAVCSP